MSRTRNRFTAVALSMVAIAALSLPAGADDAPPSGGDPATNPALINDAADASLHITKYSGGDNGIPANGAPGGAPTNPLNTPLAGVTYAIHQVPGVDLATNAGWAAAVAYYDNIAGAQTAIGTAAATATGTTDAAGQVSFENLALGLYLVTETAAPDGYTKAPPFLVTLPMTNPLDGTRWMYDVYVYPKNQLDTITIAVVDQGTQTTDDSDGLASWHLVDYVVTSSIPDGTTALGAYVVQQDLDDSLTPHAVFLELSDGTPLEEGTDYEVYATAPGTSTPVLWDGSADLPEGAIITVVFTDAGLGVLEDNRAVSVLTTIYTTLGEQDADGVVPAAATFIPSSAWLGQNCPTCVVDYDDPTTLAALTGTGLPSNDVESRYGDLAITKTDALDGAFVEGAEFMVYEDADYDGACNDSDLVEDGVIGGPLGTGVDGVLVYNGLQTSDFYNGTTQTDLITYCLVETKAPDGYNLLADPIAFTILSTNAGFVTDLEIKNQQTTLGNRLPLTGGEGIAALGLGGLLLIGGGAGYYAFTSRKRRTA